MYFLNPKTNGLTYHQLSIWAIVYLTVQKDSSKAIRYLKKAIKLAPHESYLGCMIAMIYRQKKIPTRPFDVYRKRCVGIPANRMCCG